MHLQVVIPPEVTMVYWDDKYGFASLPKAKIAEIALVCQAVWQPLPGNHLEIKK